MSDYHHQLPATELDPVFQFARDTWTNSFDRFSGDPGDIDAFNRDTGNDIFIIQHQLGESFNGHTLDQNIPYFVYLWRPGIRKKMRKDFEIRGWRLTICKIFEITKTIYSNSERAVKVLKQNAFLTCSWRIFRSNNLNN